MGRENGGKNHPHSGDGGKASVSALVLSRFRRCENYGSGRHVPGQKGAGRIFYNQVKLSGRIPQICLLFGPSSAGGAYIPAFCDIVIMVEGNASMYLGSPRMAEMVIGEKVSLEEMGGARMHCSVSGRGDLLARTEQEAIMMAQTYLSYFPSNYTEKAPVNKSKNPKAFEKPLSDVIPAHQNAPFNMMDLIERVIDEDSFLRLNRYLRRN